MDYFHPFEPVRPPVPDNFQVGVPIVDLLVLIEPTAILSASHISLGHQSNALCDASVVSIFSLAAALTQPAPSLSSLFATSTASRTRLLGTHPGPSSDRSQRLSSRTFEPSARLPVTGQRPRHIYNRSEREEEGRWAGQRVQRSTAPA